jgi:geranyl-CoA carboxylase alpha subunit
MKPIGTLLVANRGEIAVRIMETANAMGIKTVAVYSDADADALHVRVADQAMHIGGALVSESYLDIESVLDAARKAGADAVHPGYGFLSENQAFASACEQAGIIFVGPSNTAIDIMGDKAKAKRAMIDAGVPCIPGYQGEDQSTPVLIAEAQKIGLPVMIKAAAGGGGRGMRLVTEDSDLERAIELAQSEAENAFGSRDVILEKAIVQPRHVEIQVFADAHGKIIHLGERDCSIQRRHQKVVEESPCPVMSSELREQMGQAAVEAARAVNYVGAGTVEFLLDDKHQFYFLEMNTRLQVEHPVTEAVTGFDLVEWQLRIARGEPLPVTQSAVSLIGHAIEVRLYAENPAEGFLPSTGTVEHFFFLEQEGLRVDSGVESGDEVSPYYDAMVAKIIGYGETREDARLRLMTALQRGALFGPATNRDFLIDVLKQPVFVQGGATTAFIEQHYGASFVQSATDSAQLAAAVVIQRVLALGDAHAASLSVSHELLDWCSSGEVVTQHELSVDGKVFSVALTTSGPGDYRVSVGDNDHQVEFDGIEGSVCALVIDGRALAFQFYSRGAATLCLASSNQTQVITDLTRLPPDLTEAAAGGAIVAPMHGQLVALDVAAGDPVQAGQRLAILEAMKMQHEIVAPDAGTVDTIFSAAGKQVAQGDMLLTLSLASEAEG